MDNMERFATDRLAGLKDDDLYREMLDADRCRPARVTRGGRELVSFCCNDYLGLSQHPAVKQAAVAAIETFGAGAGASRLVTGNHSLYRKLERSLAEIKGTAAACVFGSGYLVNSGVMPCFAGAGDLVLIDHFAHSCLYAGAALSKAEVVRFQHNDIADLRALLDRHRAGHGKCMIVTEGVFSMDGDLAPLPDLAALAKEYDAWLMCDDAHGLGVIGTGGRGAAFAHGGPVEVALQTGTLSKAVGGYGGYVCASEPVIDWIRNRARTLIYSTGLPPATIAAATKAIEIMRGDPELRAAPLARARLFASKLGLAEPQSCIIPIAAGDAATALSASRALEQQGYLVTAIRPPTVPEGTARLRFTFSAGHDDGDVIGVARAVRDIGLMP